MESGFASLAQVWKVVFNTKTSVESGLQDQHKCGKWFLITGTSVESGFATPTQVRKVVLQLAQVGKVVLQHEQKCEKWISTLTVAQKVVLQHQHKCGKWFCITGSSVESGFQH